MSKINLIDKSIYNRISAGEVVERPLSVVKECVENSIDGGATAITVWISNKARNITIKDDGVGMSRDDALKAFLPHATSKLCCVEDLETIQTLGFRGEALASIGSVASVTLRTCDRESGVRTEVEIRGGNIGEATDCAIDCGTEIIVENLFYNTPVREKFLKSTKSEENMIVDLMEKFIFAYPEMKFSLYIDNVLKYKFDGDGFEKAIYCVYGKELLDKTIYIDETKHGVHLRGYISRVSYSKPNRSYQTVIINGRHIINDTVNTAIYKAYQPYMMKHCFPVCVLHMSIAAEDIDVNVHPTKHDVRFSDTRKVFSGIHSIISKALEDSFFKRDISNDDIPSLRIKKPEGEKIKDTISLDEMPVSMRVAINHTTVIPVQKPALDDKFYNTLDNPVFDAEVKRIQNNLDEIAKGVEKGDLYSILADRTHKASFDLSKARIIGVFDCTYIIAEMDEKLYLIDQHAAHERVLFDEYYAQYLSKKVIRQELLVPYILNVNSVENDFIRKNITPLFMMGFKLEPFGLNSYRVLAVPYTFCNVDIEKLFNDVLSEQGDIINEPFPYVIQEKIILRACKHAVKAGDRLSMMEIEGLMSKLPVVKSLTCPHGRPITVEITKREIEKMFKRIL